MASPLIFSSNSFYFFFRVKNILLYEKINGGNCYVIIRY